MHVECTVSKNRAREIISLPFPYPPTPQELFLEVTKSLKLIKFKHSDALQAWLPFGQAEDWFDVTDVERLPPSNLRLRLVHEHVDGTAVDHFKSLLHQKIQRPKDEVLQKIARFRFGLMHHVSTAEEAEQLYRECERIQATTTLNTLFTDSEYVHNGHLPHLPDKFTLVFHKTNPRPLVAKGVVPRMGCEREWVPRSPVDAQANHVVPAISVKGFSVMPLYCCSLQQVPPATFQTFAEQWGRQIESAVAYMHSSHVMHGDITESNIFLDADGRAFLGDFGSVVSFGMDIHSMTVVYWPQDFRPEKATPALDWLLLAVTWLGLLGKLTISSEFTLRTVASSSTAARSPQIVQWLMKSEIFALTPTLAD